MDDRERTPVPQWVKALSEEERRERGYVRTHTQKDGNPNCDAERKIAVAVMVAGALVGTIGAMLLGGSPVTMMIVGTVVVIIGGGVWMNAERYGEWYSTEWVMSDEEIAKLAVREEQAVKNAEQIAAAISAHAAQIAMPTGFSVSAFKPVYPFKRPGEDGRADFEATMRYHGSGAQDETTIRAGQYWVHKPEAVIENLTGGMYGKIKAGIEELRERLQIVA